jgi:hypothetical protein
MLAAGWAENARAELAEKDKRYAEKEKKNQ